MSAAAEACFVSQPSPVGAAAAAGAGARRGAVRAHQPRAGADRRRAAAGPARGAGGGRGPRRRGGRARGGRDRLRHRRVRHVLDRPPARLRRGHRRRSGSRYPGVRLRIVSRNSTEIADAVRRGELEAGLVALPVDERGLVVGERVWTTEAVYVTADRDRLRGEPRSIQQLAAAQLVLPEVLAGDDDPTRRQLSERAADAGVRLEPVVEVESPAGRAGPRRARRRRHGRVASLIATRSATGSPGCRWTRRCGSASRSSRRRGAPPVAGDDGADRDRRGTLVAL